MTSCFWTKWYKSQEKFELRFNCGIYKSIPKNVNNVGALGPHMELSIVTPWFKLNVSLTKKYYRSQPLFVYITELGLSPRGTSSMEKSWCWMWLEMPNVSNQYTIFFWFVSFWLDHLNFLTDPSDLFTHILRACFAASGVIVWLSQRQ